MCTIRVMFWNCDIEKEQGHKQSTEWKKMNFVSNSSRILFFFLRGDIKDPEIKEVIKPVTLAAQ